MCGIEEAPTCWTYDMVLRSPWREWLAPPATPATFFNDMQPVLVYDPAAGPGGAVDLGLGLVYGALCNHCDSAAEDVEVIASGKPSVTAVECTYVPGRRICVYGGACVCARNGNAYLPGRRVRVCVYVHTHLLDDGGLRLRAR
eukprot:353841-Chlamydomonas_euryale.AAC.1